MKLHLIRHGDTNLQSESGKDFDRKLHNDGEQQALQLGEYLKDKLVVKQVFCSDAVVQFFQIVPHSNDDFMPPYIILMHLNINYLKYFTKTFKDLQRWVVLILLTYITIPYKTSLFIKIRNNFLYMR